MRLTQAIPGATRRLLAALGLIAVAGATAVAAPSPEEIGWEALLPEQMQELEKEADRLDRMLSEMPPATREIYDTVAVEMSARDTVDMGVLGASDLRQDRRQALSRKLSDEHPEAVAFWNRVAALREEFGKLDEVLREDLDGRRVRIAGYLLPLEFEGTRVKEFLLVPYVGACIHVPPPPANQTVFVRAKDAFANEGLFMPVWVEGEISARLNSSDLSFVDGSSEVLSGYAIQASHIERYE